VAWCSVTALYVATYIRGAGK